MNTIIKINLKNPESDKIKKIGSYLKLGKILVFPTDTVYGIGCDPFNIESIKKIYKIKRRNTKKGLPVLIYSIKVIKKFVVMNDLAKNLIKEFWPGQLTLILNKNEKVPEILTGGKKTIAIRQPNNLITMLIAEQINYGGIIGTSANISGEKAPISIDEAMNQLGDTVDYYIDGGISDKKVPSTVLNLTIKPPKLLREGSILFEDIKRYII